MIRSGRFKSNEGFFAHFPKINVIDVAGQCMIHREDD